MEYRDPDKRWGKMTPAQRQELFERGLRDYGGPGGFAWAILKELWRRFWKGLWR